MIHVAIHPSQFPDRVRADLLDSLRRREIKHKFHYESYKQARKWLALHEAHSPARQDHDCAAIYDNAGEALAEKLSGASVHIVGLGCGGGHKDAALAARLRSAGASIIYTAVDVSLPLVITARERLAPFCSTTRALVCDLEAAQDLRDEVCECNVSQRIFTFFGLIPNSEPDVILPQLRKLLAPGDALVMNANLTPGVDYKRGVSAVLPQYANPLTFDWLLTFLEDLGVEREDGEVLFSIEHCPFALLRIRADFEFVNQRTLEVEGEKFAFASQEKIRLFYSYRYTPALLRDILAKYDLKMGQQWLAPSGEEGVFLIEA